MRRFAAADLDALQGYRNDEETARYQSWSVMSTEAAQQFLAEMAAAPMFVLGEWFQVAIADAKSDRLIGDIGICVRTDTGGVRFAEIGFTLAREAQGKGLATEAVRETLAMLFGHADVDHVIGITDTRNAASIQLLKRVGMTLRETVDATFRGKPCQEHVFEARRGV
ncbi:MAG TPA: GNAT family N-acetyltransferase [Candidatus Eisenbacteria bacterium]|nr:GNAT family N-acetyltransferase [Candidatus Eisenbacteria bacterium]